MSKRPNILWIITSQWRSFATGYSGDLNAQTPWLDGVAGTATNFGQAITPHPMGPQARAALFTGKLSAENGVIDYWEPLPTDARTIAHALNDRGYSTAFFGKWHLGVRDRSVPFVSAAHAKQIIRKEQRGGFEFWEGFESGFLLNDPWLHGTRLTEPTLFKGYQADVLIHRAAEWIRGSHSKPTFCVVSLESPHPPYHDRTPHVAETNPAEVTLRPNVPLGGAVEKQARDELAGYYAHIEATDRSIGKLVTEVDLTNTALVFTSVHGDMHGSHGLFRKAWPYEESIRVPLLVSHPDLSPFPRLNDTPISLVDIPHMTLAWAEGREWHCKRDHALVSMPKGVSIPLQCPHAWHGFRTSKRKLILNADGSPWLYFDLESDPFEKNNMALDPGRSGEIDQLKLIL